MSQQKTLDESSELAKKIKLAAPGVFSQGGTTGKPVGNLDKTSPQSKKKPDLVCDHGHPITIERASDLYESQTGKSLRATCSGCSWIFEW